MEHTYEGEVKRFNERGFGFLCCAELNYQVFFHVKDFMRGSDPVVGEKVTFILGPSLIVGKPDSAKKVTPQAPVVSGLEAIKVGA